MPSPSETVNLIRRLLAGNSGYGSVEEVDTGLLRLGVQTIDMDDAQVALGISDLTSSVLFVDPNSAGASEDLLLPAESDSAGLVLVIVNTGGETIAVKDDGGGATVATIAKTEIGIVVCDGTTWRGGAIAVAVPAA